MPHNTRKEKKNKRRNMGTRECFFFPILFYFFSSSIGGLYTLYSKDQFVYEDQHLAAGIWPTKKRKIFFLILIFFRYLFNFSMSRQLLYFESFFFFCCNIYRNLKILMTFKRLAIEYYCVRWKTIVFPIEQFAYKILIFFPRYFIHFKSI